MRVSIGRVRVESVRNAKWSSAVIIIVSYLVGYRILEILTPPTFLLHFYALIFFKIKKIVNILFF